MRRWLFMIIVAPVTFALGLSVAAILKEQRPVSLCALEAQPEIFAGKTFRFRALVKRHKDFIIAGSNCSADSGASVSIELAASEDAKASFPESFISADGETDIIYDVDAVIVGQLSPQIGMGCFAPKYHITNARVEHIFSVHRSTSSKDELEWYTSNSY